MGKKWSCPECEYKSGRGSNVVRHIRRKHGNYEVPVLTEFRHTVPHHQAPSRYYSNPYFPQLSHEGLVKSTKEKKEEAFISSYIFQDKQLGIYKKFRDATKLSHSEDRDLIVKDLMLQMERVSSNPNQFWLDPLKIMTSAKITYPSPSYSAPTWWQEISKLMESKIPNNSDSSVSVKSDSAVKANVSSDSHKRKLQVVFQRFLDYRKEREKCGHYIREFGDHAKSRKTDKSKPN
jgi:hypothetical protein